MRRFGAWVRVALAALLIAPMMPGAALPQAPGDVAVEPGPPDYAAWEKTARRAEGQTDDSAATDDALIEMRGYLVDWRATFQVAQTTNVTRIATLRTQIDALGPAPAEGVTEAPEIAQRRKVLGDQLSQLSAPGVAADEAYRRADGLIREIDRILRERQADELLRLLPSPVNPANWPDALKAVTEASVTLWREVDTAMASQPRREALQGSLPLILMLVVVGVGALMRGRRLTDRISRMAQARLSHPWARVWEPVISVGQVILPSLGLVALATAAARTSMLGAVGALLSAALATAGFLILAARWLGGRIFPKSDAVTGPFRLGEEQRTEGRLLTTVMGGLVGLTVVRNAILPQAGLGDAAFAVLSLPITVVTGLLLYRIGGLLRAHLHNATPADEQPAFADRMIGLAGQGIRAIGIGGPVLAAIGYVPAAEALLQPAALTLGLMGALFLVQQMVERIYALLTGQGPESRDALAPVLIGFGLAIGSLPLVALIWGARVSDLTELWTRFREGFAIGETRISPTSFLVFAVVFAIGYMVTRLLQGALKSSILPRTNLDQGGQNAIISGIGYVGVFLAALAAINSAGINLAGIAIVAGALSVGIGFGLQNIVSNFVSGIILLIERPVSEGDWIEVGGVQGVVKAISVRSTRIQTFDRTDVIVPNTDLIAGRVTNWTRFSLTGRLIVPVNVAHGSDTRLVERVLKEIAEAEPLAVMNPAPQILFMGMTPDAMQFEIRLILRDVNFQLSVRSHINHEVVRRLGQQDIQIALSAAAQTQLIRPEVVAPVPVVPGIPHRENPDPAMPVPPIRGDSR